ncbi:MAG: hypothetical protein HW421_1008 [Ignavibacteria bacterium]|nr:hypothetical protein [Ignavibacteria bacterium]
MIAVKNTRKASSKIVRAWFDTVLNRITSGLSLVLYYLSKDDYTWSCTYQNFIEFKTLGEYYDFKFQANFEQLVHTEYRELLDLNIEYDEKRKKFNDACIELFQQLISSKDLQKLLVENINKYENLLEISKVDAEYFKRSNSINWLVEYMINNKNVLPDNNIFRILWNNEKEDFYKILKIDGINQANLEVKENRRLFEEITIKTLNSIKENCYNLSLKYGEPIVI